MHPGGVFDCSSGSSSFGDDSDEMDDQEFDNVFESRRDVTDNSVSWTEAMNAQSQNNLNLFELPESPRERLHSHFCSGIVSALKQAMQQCSATKELSNHHQALVIDTLMMMQYFKVHFARKRDLWDMMVGKAEIALLRILQFSLEDDDALEPFDMILECSTAHAHFLPGEKLPDDGRPGPFPPSTAMKSCLACATAPDTDVSAHKGSHPEGPMALDCPFQNCEEIETEWNDWDKLWEHQVMSGHVVCRKREWFGNLDDEFSE
ncbi:hypothetical protein BHE90_010296 [Fusarium euwallaceae]|uniref:Uncharacterized protein n=2 Tax=Fusarium solani species complex TaxID=232080 RepID=A0A3M2RR07_9HYPO|nr:hypothetical protein CDV36_012654 [Fusarium kuroshium]RTE75255.1 hypothetical protein BHE90_010296 [Fusarium euwallaceae]